VIRILVTGSRKLTAWQPVAEALDEVAEECDRLDGGLLLVHGGCPTGADQIADRVWRRWMPSFPRLLEPEVHRANWGHCTPECPLGHRKQRGAGTYCPLAGFRRNAEMAALGAYICLAFPLGESPGTRNCMMLAEKAGIPVRVFEAA